MKIDNSDRFFFECSVSSDWNRLSHANRSDIKSFKTAMQYPESPHLSTSLWERYEMQGMPAADPVHINWRAGEQDLLNLESDAPPPIQPVYSAPVDSMPSPVSAEQLHAQRLNEFDPMMTDHLRRQAAVTTQRGRDNADYAVGLEAQMMIAAAPAKSAKESMRELTAEERLNKYDPMMTEHLERKAAVNQGRAMVDSNYALELEATTPIVAAPNEMGVVQTQLEIKKLDHAIEMAALADDVYYDAAPVRDNDPYNADNDRAQLPDGFRRLSVEELEGYGISENEYNETKSGYFAALYVNEDSGRLIVANRGTELDSWNDMSDNIKHPFIGDTEQYRAARLLATKVTGEFGDNYKIEFTGHSLGGNLAAYQALLTGFDATTFNAAGLSSITRNELSNSADGVNRLAFEKEQITAFYVDGDPLSEIQDSRAIDVGIAIAIDRGTGNILGAAVKSRHLLHDSTDLSNKAHLLGIDLVNDYIPNAAGTRHRLTAVGLDNQAWQWSDILSDQAALLLGAETDPNAVWFWSAALDLHGIAATQRSLHYDLREHQKHLDSLGS